MKIKLPPAIDSALHPLFISLPLDRALAHLVPKMPSGPAFSVQAEKLAALQVIAGAPPLVAGLWLYVDELDRSHKVSQSINDPTGSFWHGIMHRREGDFSNSHYWFKRAGAHPAMNNIAGYDPHRFIDEVEGTHASGDRADLVDLQRREWAELMIWCAAEVR
jgi:hypothetical protein